MNDGSKCVIIHAKILPPRTDRAQKSGLDLRREKSRGLNRENGRVHVFRSTERARDSKTIQRFFCGQTEIRRLRRRGLVPKELPAIHFSSSKKVCSIREGVGERERGFLFPLNQFQGGSPSVWIWDLLRIY